MRPLTFVLAFFLLQIIFFHNNNGNVVLGKNTRDAVTAYYLNATAAMNFCSPACNFNDASVWDNGDVPEMGSDILY
jgi:hypothetical protein